MNDEFFQIRGTDDKEVKLKRGQLKSSVLGKIFSLWPDTLFLLSESGIVVTPDDQGEFVSDDLGEERIWSCDGDSCKPPSSSREQQYFYQQGPSTSRGYVPPYSSSRRRSSGPGPSQVQAPKRPRPPGVQQQETTLEWLKNVEIYKRSASSGLLEKKTNLPVTLTEETATVNGVSNLVSTLSFSGKEVFLLDTEFLEIPDISSTKGLKFWRSGGKKIIAVSKEDYSIARPSAKRRNIAADESHARSKRPALMIPDRLESRLQRVEESLSLRADVEQARTDKLIAEANVAQLQVKLSAANEKLSRITECYKCLICMTCPAFPVYKSPCCEVILGCHSCVITWVNSSGSCPHCRSELAEDSLIDMPFVRPLQSILSEI